MGRAHAVEWGGKAAEMVAQVDKWNVLTGSDKKTAWSVRVLAFGLAFAIPARRMIRLRQSYGETGNTGMRSRRRTRPLDG
jgi:hypothetical protein